MSSMISDSKADVCVPPTAASFGFSYKFFASFECEPIGFNGLPDKTVYYRFNRLWLKVLFFEL